MNILIGVLGAVGLGVHFHLGFWGTICLTAVVYSITPYQPRK